MALIAIARDESNLDSIAVNAFQDRAVAELTDTVQRLYALRTGAGGITAMAVAAPVTSRIGRNDPCHCGSGKKRKQCCG